VLVTPTAEPSSLTALSGSDPSSDVAVATVDSTVGTGDGPDPGVAVATVDSTVGTGDGPDPGADWAGGASAGRVGNCVVGNQTA
jgi:hypothetical protein